jgi:Tfp pilus assembly PilM family ATPase
MFRAKDRKATGIHFSDNRLRIVELTGAQGRVALRSAVQTKLDHPLGYAMLSVPGLRQELATVLRRLGERRNIDYARPCVAIDPGSVLIKRHPLIFAGTQTGKVRQANREQLQWEARQLLEDESEQFTVDFALGRTDGFVVAVRRSLLLLYRELFAVAGIEDPVFDIESFALYNAAEAAGLSGESGRQLLLDSAPARVQGLLLEDGDLVGVARCAAEANERPSPTELLERCVRQLEEDRGEAEVRQAWVAGEMAGALSAELAGRLTARCGIFDPFAALDTAAVADGPTTGPEFAVATGLAYRRLTE